MTTSLPSTNTLQLKEVQSVLHITLHRPKAKNAMSLEMVDELVQVFNYIEQQPNIRIAILRGSENNFCAGGDIKDMANARSQKTSDSSDPFYDLNRKFGHMLTQADKLPCVLISVLEGAVLGGGFGLACVSDLSIALEKTVFGLPETSLGIVPAQIAPFVVKRIGLTQARRLALMGLRINEEEALKLGITHETCTNDEIDQILEKHVQQILRCAPHANRTTKALLHNTLNSDIENVLDEAAQLFSNAVNGDEGKEGTMAFVQKRPASWAS